MPELCFLGTLKVPLEAWRKKLENSFMDRVLQEFLVTVLWGRYDNENLVRRKKPPCGG